MTRTTAILIAAALAPNSAFAVSGYFTLSDCDKVSSTSSSAHLCACAQKAGEVNLGTSTWTHFLNGFTATSGFVVDQADDSRGNHCLDLRSMVNGSTNANARNSFTEMVQLALDTASAEWPLLGGGRELGHSYTTFDGIPDSPSRRDTVAEGGSHFIGFGQTGGVDLPGNLPPYTIVDLGNGSFEILEQQGSLAEVTSNSPPIGVHAEVNSETGQLDVTTFHADGSSAILHNAGPGMQYQLPF